jgi:hypothetical protein
VKLSGSPIIGHNYDVGRASSRLGIWMKTDPNGTGYALTGPLRRFTKFRRGVAGSASTITGRSRRPSQTACLRLRSTFTIAGP